MSPKPRPERLYREEYLNEHDEWCCSRMTYDSKQYELWQAAEWWKNGRPKLMSERYRFAWAEITWHEDANG